ncbi:MAG: hypothetical protein ACOYNZ_02165 [Rhodoferax sp.]
MKSLLAFVVASVLLTACGRSENHYTLYQASFMNPNMRKHVATFDAADGKDYNIQNCRSIQYLYQKQAGPDARFWCEFGPYRKT